ncbi:histidine phosphatase family protein [Streptomyces sp. NPDC093094]|uniref:histidine phosphatase family protein n=1 Tax=Streptomyces sp. NPDC093094 TaxID=3366026 RepID=UPI0038127D0B
MRLLLVRHAQTVANVDFLLDTAYPGAELTELGERQAAALPEALAGEDVTAVYASPLTRTRRTAAPLAAARGLEVRVRDGLREVTAGDLEMLPGGSPRGQTFMRTVVAWMEGATRLRMPGGETGEEVLARYDAVVAEAADGGAGTAVLVSHGAAVRLWTAVRAGNLDAPFGASQGLENTGVVVLEGSPSDGWTALSWAGALVEGTGPVVEEGPAGRPLGEADRHGPDPAGPGGGPGGAV